MEQYDMVTADVSFHIVYPIGEKLLRRCHLQEIERRKPEMATAFSIFKSYPRPTNRTHGRILSGQDTPSLQRYWTQSWNAGEICDHPVDPVSCQRTTDPGRDEVMGGNRSYIQQNSQPESRENVLNPLNPWERGCPCGQEFLVRSSACLNLG
jgi:hypothetical protein